VTLALFSPLEGSFYEGLKKDSPLLSLFSVLCAALLVGLLCFLGVFLEGSCSFCLLTGEF